jgi:hypothetical protein
MAPHTVSAELPPQFGLRLTVPGEHEQATRVSIKPMNREHGTSVTEKSREPIGKRQRQISFGPLAEFR